MKRQTEGISIGLLLRESVVLFFLWLVLFFLCRVFVYSRGGPNTLNLTNILVRGVGSDFWGFLLICPLWVNLRVLSPTSMPARYAPVFLLGIVSVFAFCNAVFITWAHEPLNPSFFTYVRDLRVVSSSLGGLPVSGSRMFLLAAGIVFVLMAVYLHCRYAARYLLKSDGRFLQNAAAVMIVLVLIGGSANMSNLERPPDRYSVALAGNVLVHQVEYQFRRKAGFSAMSPEPRQGRNLWGAEAIRETLVTGRGECSYLAEDFPLVKHDLSYSRDAGEGDVYPDRSSERPNIVILFMESLRARDIGAYGSTQGLTPNFDSLASHGWLWENFYASGVQTPRAALAVLCSLYPHFGPSIQRSHPEFALRGLPHILREEGYVTEFHHNGYLSFDHKDVFFSNLGFDRVLGMKDMDPNGEFGVVGWGFPDLYFMDLLADRLNRSRIGKPLFLTAFTATHHHPWDTPDPSFELIKGDDEYSKFRNSLYYSDHALGRLFDNLEPEVLATTVFVITADTAQPMGEHDDNFALLHHLYEENVRIPLLIYAPGSIKKASRFTEVASQIDIMPTILDMLGIASINHAVGRSLLRPVADPYAYFSNPFFQGWAGMRRGPHKYILQLADQKEFLFDLETDPAETRNLAAKIPKTTTAMRNRTLSIFLATEYLYARQRLWSADLLALSEHRWTPTRH